MNDTIIELRQLAFRWQERAPLVLDIEQFRIARGERVFIKGASGSGKSTLLSLLGGVLTPQHGEIHVLGRALHQLRGSQRDVFRADHIGFVFQMFNLIPYLSVLENVLLPLQFSALRRARVAERGSLEQEAERLLAHLDLRDELLQRPVTELSVGQQQRVAAARALIGRPEIVIADEPTSSLDADRREAFIRLLISECDEAHNTLVFVSHDSSLERFFDHTVSLHDINKAAIPSTEVA
jgi:putative ABC transport system ATP-binding protein